jgi:hypothetical protein
MSEIKTGGPAFPLTEDAVNHRNKDFDMQGMTLRDYYVGKALQGLMANPNVVGQHSSWGHDEIASFTLKQADASLKAREAKP